MSYIFNQDTIDGFIAFVKTGGSRDQVVREISEYIYTDCSWSNAWDRHEMLEELIKIIYHEQ